MMIAYHTHPLPYSFTHSHAEYEITYCVCGSYEFHYSTGPGEHWMEKIRPKTMIFMPKGVEHGVENVEYPYQRIFINLPVHQAISWLDNPALLSPFSSSMENEAGEKRPMPVFLRTGGASSMVETILNRMLEVQVFSDVDNSHTDLHLRCLLGLLFCELYRIHQGFFSAPQASRSRMITKVREFIDQNYHLSLTIQDLAKQHFVHPNYLTHCFTKQMGISPRKYLTNLRLANARKLLESEDDTVQNIALRVGFGNVNNFIQSFRLRYGVTPRSYRKKAITDITG